MTTPVSVLAGRRILVTRPAGQAAHLAQLIRAAGGEPVLFPVLEIIDTQNLEPLIALVKRLDAFDLAIFVSPSAVNKALDRVLAARSWPGALRVATIGRGSERELHRRGMTGVIAPRGRFDSEALLDLPELKDMAGKRVVIFRGDGGRELLGDTLAARGATVEYAECYRRVRPRADAAPLLKLWEKKQLDALTVTSSEGLANLHDMVGEPGRQWMKQTPLFAPHQRIADAARAMGVEPVMLTRGGDEGMVAGLAAFFAKV
jgi:uroporphyrinogen-III synthase